MSMVQTYPQAAAKEWADALKNHPYVKKNKLKVEVATSKHKLDPKIDPLSLDVLCVCDMYVVGFDAPKMSLLYYDRPIPKNFSEAQLVQNLSRACRKHPSKTSIVVGICSESHQAKEKEKNEKRAYNTVEEKI